MEYSEKLRDPRWQRKRLQIFERDQWACRCCRDTGTTLHCHHLKYIPNREPWDYPDKDFLTLCEPCHEIWINREPTFRVMTPQEEAERIRFLKEQAIELLESTSI
jgi:5-methylcytosine-specific restriction endonuclease McrA